MFGNTTETLGHCRYTTLKVVKKQHKMLLLSGMYVLANTALYVVLRGQATAFGGIRINALLYNTIIINIPKYCGAMCRQT
jgi:hypothetical protein